MVKINNIEKEKRTRQNFEKNSILDFGPDDSFLNGQSL